MANYSNLLATIAANIYTNHNNQVSAAMVKAAVDAMVASLGAGYQLMGIAHPTDMPSGYADLRCCWFAFDPGEYTNFGGLEVENGEIAVIKFDGNWGKEHLGLFIDNLSIPLTETGYITTQGTLYVRSDWSASDFISVSGGEKVTISGFMGNSTGVNIAGYDSNKKFVRQLYNGTGAVRGHTEVIPTDISFIRVSMANDTHGSYIPIFAGVEASYGVISGAVKKIGEFQSSLDILFLIADTLGIRYYLMNWGEYTGDIDTGWGPSHDSVISYENDYFYVDCGQTNKHFPGIRSDSLGAELASLNSGLRISFYARLADDSPYNEFRVYINSGSYFTKDLTASWQRFEIELSKAEAILMTRVQFAMANLSGNIISGLGFYIKEMAVEIGTAIVGRVDVLEEKVASLEDGVGNLLKDKKISIIGDSISTIYGGNAAYITILDSDVGQAIKSYVTWFDIYTNQAGSNPTNKTIGGIALTAAMIGTLQTFTPIAEDVGKRIGVSANYNDAAIVPWQKRVCEDTGAVLLSNVSWSGARICSGQVDSYVLSEAWSDYTIGCLKQRDADGVEITPDVVIVYRGTNDFSHSPVSRLAAVSLTNGIPATDYIDGYYEFRAGYYLTIQKIREKYPKAFVIICTLNVFKRSTYNVFPTRNNYYTLPQLNDTIREIANTMGCGLIEFDKDGITFENCYPDFISDSSTIPTHPNNNGHRVMSKRAEADLKYILK